VERVIREALGGRPVQVFLAPPGEPHTVTVDAAADRVRATPQPVVIGLGGGSALDVAKLAAALAACDGRVEQRLLGAYHWPGRSTTIAIPTTAARARRPRGPASSPMTRAASSGPGARPCFQPWWCWRPSSPGACRRT
jgi:alcohol dehydrogenase class IV